MAFARSALAIAALGLLLLPASALADADVTRDASGILMVNDDFNGAVADDITISQNGSSNLVITMNTQGQALFNSDANCNGAGSTQNTCAQVGNPSIAVDMKTGNDVVTVASNVTVPVSIDGG